MHGQTDLIPFQQRLEALSAIIRDDEMTVRDYKFYWSVNSTDAASPPISLGVEGPHSRMYVTAKLLHKVGKSLSELSDELVPIPATLVHIRR